MEHTTHSLLVGESATAFAVDMGFKYEALDTPRSLKVHSLWTQSRCQPNSFITAHSNSSCPPYGVNHHDHRHHIRRTQREHGGSYPEPYALDHDTIGMIAVDGKGFMTVGTSTNGLFQSGWTMFQSG